MARIRIIYPHRKSLSQYHGRENILPAPMCKQIVIICHVDAGNTGKHLSSAIKCLPGINVKYITRKNTQGEISKAINMADIIWVKGDTPAVIKNGRFTLLIGRGDKGIPKMENINTKAGVKLVLSPGGSSFRRPIIGYAKSYGLAPLEMFYENADIVAPITPDLNYPILNGIYLPHAIDEHKMSTCWKRGDEFVVGAYVGQCDSKHVYSCLVPAINILAKKGLPIKLNLTIGVSLPHEKFLQKLKECTLYYDQVNPLGVYGRSGVEAMSMGIPIIASINDTAVKQARYIEGYGEPCLRAHDIESLAATIEDAYSGKIDLDEVSRQSKKYASRVHSYESVAKYAHAHIISRLQ